ncbi:MAG TPA: 50S ribosomal protein L25 [Solirubrobacteraceae bacterium]|jgi:large subunit ribosomal protein L25
MATTAATTLSVQPREPSGSRGARRLRRSGQVLGVVYGGGEEPLSFQVDARELRNALAHAGAVLELQIGGASSPVVLKELVRHPVNGNTMHIDLLRVRLDEAIHSSVVVELLGSEDSPGVKEGGVLDQVTREVNIEALPNDIPDSLSFDVSGLVIGDTITLESLSTPAEVTLLDEPETVLVTLNPPRLVIEEEPEVEEETELVGEGEEAPEGEGEAAAEGDGGGEGGEGESGE